MTTSPPPTSTTAVSGQRGARVQIKITVDDPQLMVSLLGPRDGTLKLIESSLDCDILVRGNEITLSGPAADVALAERVFAELLELIGKGEALNEGVVRRIVGMLKQGTEERPADVLTLNILSRRGRTIRPKTLGQKRYVDAIRTHDISFGIGPAGTGKTYLAVACAVDALERDTVKRIVLVRPAVEAGERLGFLPGDLAQKVDPYLRPLFDALYDLMGFDKAARLLERQTIELAPLAYMRGRTLNHSFIILDEAQNTTPEQMKMFLTRIGFGTRAVITGDVTQIDLARGQKSGLIEAGRVLKDVRGIAFVRFTSADVVRHPLVQKIIDAYDRDTSA